MGYESAVTTMEQKLTSAEQIERCLPLQKEILKLTCGSIPSRWGLPVLEINITFDDFHRFQSLNARLYNLEGEEELERLPEALLKAATAYHALFMSFGVAWIRGMLTITPDKDGRVVGYKWNYTYPPYRLSESPI